MLCGGMLEDAVDDVAELCAILANCQLHRRLAAVDPPVAREIAALGDADAAGMGGSRSGIPGLTRVLIRVGPGGSAVAADSQHQESAGSGAYHGHHSDEVIYQKRHSSTKTTGPTGRPLTRATAREDLLSAIQLTHQRKSRDPPCGGSRHVTCESRGRLRPSTSAPPGDYRSNKSMSCDVSLHALFRQGSPNPVSRVFNKSK